MIAYLSTAKVSINHVFLQGGNSDELNLREQEQLEVIADGDGDGWVRVSTTSEKVYINSCGAVYSVILYQL